MKRALVVVAATVALGAPAVASDFVFRARPIPITAAAPPLPDGAVRSGDDVLLAPPTTADGSRPATAGATYRALRPLAEIGAELRTAKPLNILSINRTRYYVCYVPASSLPTCLQTVLRQADPQATAWERDGFLYYTSPQGFMFTPADQPQRDFLARFDFRQTRE